MFSADDDGWVSIFYDRFQKFSFPSKALEIYILRFLTFPFDRLDLALGEEVLILLVSKLSEKEVESCSVPVLL